MCPLRLRLRGKHGFLLATWLSYGAWPLCQEEALAMWRAHVRMFWLTDPVKVLTGTNK